MRKKNHKTRKFSCLFQIHKMRLLAIFGHFTDRNDSLPTLSYPSTYEISHLLYQLEASKRYVFQTQPPRIGQYREQPCPPRYGVHDLIKEEGKQANGSANFENIFERISDSKRDFNGFPDPATAAECGFIYFLGPDFGLCE